MTAYYDALMALGMRLMRMLALTLDLPRDWFVERFEKPLGSLRPIHYSGRISQPDDVRRRCALTYSLPLDHVRMGIAPAYPLHRLYSPMQWHLRPDLAACRPC